MFGEQREKFNFIRYVAARYFRLTPQLAIVILITLLLPLFGSGPIFHEFVDHIVEGCEENWWITLLYVNNYFKQDKTVCINYLLHKMFSKALKTIFMYNFLVFASYVVFSK